MKHRVLSVAWLVLVVLGLASSASAFGNWDFMLNSIKTNHTKLVSIKNQVPHELTAGMASDSEQLLENLTKAVDGLKKLSTDRIMEVKSKADLYAATAQLLKNAVHNVAEAQKKANQVAQATTSQGVALLYAIDTSSTGISSEQIFSMPELMMNTVSALKMDLDKLK
jgi:hypothetical protein